MSAVLEVALRVARACEAAGVEYFLGGSVASSLQGDPRATNDIDFVVDLQRDRVEALVAALGPDFDVDLDGLRTAVARRGSWNLFYVPDFTKIDLFVRRQTPFDDAEFARRRPARVHPAGDTLYVKAPEDTVLRKLLWFRDGGGISDRQWRDVVGVLATSGAVFDFAYAADWAARLGIESLFERARAEAKRRG
jgi:hypothetical protein